MSGTAFVTQYRWRIPYSLKPDAPAVHYAEIFCDFDLFSEISFRICRSKGFGTMARTYPLAFTTALYRIHATGRRALFLYDEISTNRRLRSLSAISGAQSVAVYSRAA